MLSLEDLRVNYGDHRVIDGLRMQCLPGEIHGILGRNGAGKTTLFRTIYGFKKKVAGNITFRGDALQKDTIAFLETNPFFYSFMKGREYLDIIGAANEKFSWQKWNSIFDLPMDDLIDTYSTGMKKKLAFIGTLALDRPILILDEPFSGVDVESNEKIRQVLNRLKSQGRTILLSSHILRSFTEVCDRISVLEQGKIKKTYARKDYGALETSIQEEVSKNITQTLDELF